MNNKSSNKVYLKVKDHSVSGEEFQLLHNRELGLLETHPQPSLVQLEEYYKSKDYISHTDSKRNLFEKLYQVIRKVSLKRKLKLINSFSSSEKILLDLGCGTGDFLLAAIQNGWDASGIEPDEKARTIANIKTRGLVFDVEQLLKFKLNSFDVITLWHVLEHLPKLEEQISIFKSLLKENGVLIVAVPNYKSYDSKFYEEYWAAFDAPRHLWHFSQKSISILFERQNMKVVKTLPLKWDAYYVSLLSEKYKFGRMNLFSALKTGWISNVRAKASGEYSSLIYVMKTT